MAPQNEQHVRNTLSRTLAFIVNVRATLCVWLDSSRHAHQEFPDGANASAAAEAAMEAHEFVGPERVGAKVCGFPGLIIALAERMQMRATS